MKNSVVADVMTRTVAVVREGTGFKDIVDKMDRYRVSALPVLDGDDRLVGIVSEADLLMKEEQPTTDARAHLLESPTHRSERKKATALTAGDVMTAPVHTIGPQATIAEAARALHELRVKRLVVTDGSDLVLGIVSRHDLLKVFLRPDDEIEREVERDVVQQAMSIPAYSVRVRVRDGVVALEGQLERRSLVTMLIELVRRLDGVVAVEEHLSYQHQHDDVSTIGADFTRPWTTFNTPR